MPGVGAWLVWFLHGLYLMVSYWQSSVIAEYYLRLNDLCLFRPTEVQISLWPVHIYPHSQSLTLQNSFLTIIKLVGTAPGEMQPMIFCSLINLKDLCWSTPGRNSVWSPFILLSVSPILLLSSRMITMKWQQLSSDGELPLTRGSVLLLFAIGGTRQFWD